KVCDDDITVTRVVDKGKGKMIDKGNVIKSRKSARSWISGIVIEKNLNPSFREDDDSDSDLDMEQIFKGNTDLEEMFNGNKDSKNEYSDKSVDYLSKGKDELISLRKRNKHEDYIDKLMHQLRDVDEKYVDVDQLKEYLTYYALENKVSLWFYRSLKDQVIARCGLRPEKLKDNEKEKQRIWNKYPSAGRDDHSNCPFRCYGKTMITEKSSHVISMNEEYTCRPGAKGGQEGLAIEIPGTALHTCVRSFKYGTLVNYKWIGKKFGNKIRQNPQIKLHEIVDLVMKMCKCIVSPSQCRNAKKFSLNEGETTTEDHYAMIRSYGKAILDSIDGSTIKLGNIFEVRNGSEASRVDEQLRTCTCRKWQLTDSSQYSTVLPSKPKKIPGMPRKQRIRALHERKFPNRVSRAGVEMTCHNSFEKRHNKSSYTKPTIIPPTKQPGEKGRPKKNVENMESGGDATNNMDESTSQVRHEGNGTGAIVKSGGDATGINMESGVDATDTNMKSRVNVIDTNAVHQRPMPLIWTKCLSLYEFNVIAKL
nr:hypothetical protein [Tanacetum cinerariifolium]